MKNLLPSSFLVIFLSISSVFAITDKYPKNPKIDAINYTFRMELSDTTDEIICEETIDIRYKEAGVQSLRIDLTNVSEASENKGMTVTKVISGGKTLNYTHENDVLLINLPNPSTKDELVQYTIFYQGVPATGLKIANNKHGDRTFFSDNWPNKARNWLATIDHPYDKATCEFIVTAPSHYQVVSNGLKMEETDLTNGKRLTHWKQSVPIASWLYVLGVARFAVQYVDEFENKSIQTWVYPQDRDAGFYDFAVPTKKVLEYYSASIGPFSYEKLANIQSNSVGGGMEAASAILYGDESVVGDRNSRWRNVVIHEIAHQWFGNAVTEYDWDDVWLSEGFATYFTLLFIENEYGRNAFVEGLVSSKERIDSFHQDNPKYLIVHDNLEDMSKVTSSHTYQKGSWILHMLRGVVGTETFWKGIRSYYKKYKDSNASTDDFKQEMEKASGMDLTNFFNQWLYQPGTLKYKGNWSYNSKKKEVKIKLKQVQNDGSLFKMPVEISIHWTKDNQTLDKIINVNEKSNEFTFEVASEPDEILLDPNYWLLMDANFTKK